MLSNIAEILSEGIYLTLVGMGSVTIALSLIILAVKCLNWCFPADDASGEVTQTQGGDEEAVDQRSKDIPRYVLAAVAVEHERRQSPIGSDLKSSRDIPREYMNEGRIVRD